MKKIFIFTVFPVLSFTVSCAVSAPVQEPPAAAPVVQSPPVAAAVLPPPEPPSPPVPEPPPVQEKSPSIKIGSFNIYTLVDSEREGNTGIIPGAGEDIINRYIPASGFKHSTNAFLIKADGQNILVDSGFGNSLFENLEELGIDPRQIDVILLTHLHGDHIGGLQREGRPLFPNARIYLSAVELEHFTRISPNQGAVAAINAYGSNVETFDAVPPGFAFKEVLPGIRAIANYGHTPGHTAYMLVSGGERIIIAGDFLHIALVQFPNPEISAVYDMDQNAAAFSRRQIIDYAARHRIPIAGMHIVDPGIGYVQAEGGGFSFTPLQ